MKTIVEQIIRTFALAVVPKSRLRGWRRAIAAVLAM
jgi:hypothetical protein